MKVYVQAYDARHRLFSPLVKPEMRTAVHVSGSGRIIHITDWHEAGLGQATVAAYEWIEENGFEFDPA